MCTNLILLDGTEIWSVGDLIKYGLMDESDIVKNRPYEWDYLRDCLCRVDIDSIIEKSGRIFKTYTGIDYEEYDSEGRSYYKDGFMIDPDRPPEPSTKDRVSITHYVKDPSYPYHIKEETES